MYFTGWWLEWGGHGTMAVWTLGGAGAGALIEFRLKRRGTPEHRAAYSPAYLPWKQSYGPRRYHALQA